MGLVKMHLTSDWAWFTFGEFYEEEGVWISDEIEFDSPSSLLLLIESAEEVLPEELRHEMGRAVIKGAFGTWCPYWALNKEIEH